MICGTCGGSVTWRGAFSNLTHTECESCGRHNNQIVEQFDDEESDEGSTMTTNTTTASQPNAAPSGDRNAVDALRNIRDVAYFDATPSGKIYYAKAENALAAIECRDAAAAPALPEPAAAQEQAKPIVQSATAMPPGLTFHGYSDADEHFGETILDYMRSRGKVGTDDLKAGDVLDVTAMWIQEQHWRVTRAGNPFEVQLISPVAAAQPLAEVSAAQAVPIALGSVAYAQVVSEYGAEHLFGPKRVITFAGDLSDLPYRSFLYAPVAQPTDTTREA